MISLFCYIIFLSLVSFYEVFFVFSSIILAPVKRLEIGEFSVVIDAGSENGGHKTAGKSVLYVLFTI